MPFIDVSNIIDDFKFRNEIPHPFLNHDALSELGLSALDAGPGGRGARGALGEHMFSSISNLDASASNIVLLCIYLHGIVCPADITYYLGSPNNTISHYLYRLSKRGLTQKVELIKRDSGKETKLKSFRSDTFYIADVKSHISKYLNSLEIKTPTENVTPRMFPHAYGVSLSTMLIDLFCHIRGDLEVKRMMFEKSLSITNRGNYVDKSDGLIAVDAVMDISLPCGNRNRTLNIEFDTGYEGLSTVADKFVDYMDTPVYNNKTDTGALYLQTILFSYNDISIVADKFKLLDSFDKYFQIFVKASIYAAFKLGCLEKPVNESLQKVLDYNISFLFDADNILSFNDEYYDIAISHASAIRTWATSLLLAYFPMVGAYISNEGESFSYISDIVDADNTIKRSALQFFFELSDFCDSSYKAAADYFSIDNMKTVLLSYLGPNVDDIDNAMSCFEPSSLMRIDYNRKQYKKAFARHMGIAKKCLDYAEGRIEIDAEGSLTQIKEPNYVKMIAISPMYMGYQVYTAATHLLNNHLSSIIYKDEFGFTDDPALIYVLSYLEGKYAGLRRETLSPDLNLGGQLGCGRMRDVLIDEAYEYLYSVVDASVETSSLVRTAILQRHYSPTLRDNDGLHLVTLMLVRSFDEIRDITKYIFRNTLNFIHDSSSYIIFALHPSLSFGFSHEKPLFYSCTQDGKIIQANIF